MNYQVASSLLHHLDQGVWDIGHAPDDVQQIFESWSLPVGLCRLLQWSWPQEDWGIGPIDMLSALRIGTQTGMEELLAAKFLLIGDAPNGDMFVIDFSVDACPVGFITHEEYDKRSNPRQFFCPAARSIASLLYRATEDRYIPCDYYEASAFNQFLRDEAVHHTYPPYERKDG